MHLWVDRYLRNHGDLQENFRLPLRLVEAAWAKLPSRTLVVTEVNTILADWIHCRGQVINTTDYFIGGGNWRPLVRSTDGDPVREEARQLREVELKYRETEAYRLLLAQVRSPSEGPRRQGRDLRERADVDAYFKRFVRLFRSVEAHGLLPHHQLDTLQLRFNNDRGLGVAVDADGRIHRLQGGNHRWAIAQVLGIRVVPVEIRLVHVEAVSSLLLSLP